MNKTKTHRINAMKTIPKTFDNADIISNGHITYSTLGKSSFVSFASLISARYFSIARRHLRMRN
jgi:hypothetical protein